MCARSSAKLGAGRSFGGENSATQPTCMWAVGLSTRRNDESSGDRRGRHPKSFGCLLPRACFVNPRYSSTAQFGGKFVTVDGASDACLGVRRAGRRLYHDSVNVPTVVIMAAGRGHAHALEAAEGPAPALRPAAAAVAGRGRARGRRRADRRRARRRAATRCGACCRRTSRSRSRTRRPAPATRC